MQQNLKKMWLLAAASLVTVTSLVNADVDSAQMRNLDNRVTALEQRRSANGMINPPGRPQVRDGVDLFIYGDLLVWNAHQNGMPVAVTNNGTALNLAHAKIKTIHSHWEPGLRVGLGYNLPFDGWDLSLSWLRLLTHGNQRIHPQADRFVFPTASHPGDLLGGATFATSASSHWRMLLNQLDLDLGREFFVSKWVTLRPHFGLRTDWIHQKWNTKYFDLAGTLAPNQVAVEYKDKWWGIGIEGGFDTQWGFGAGLSLYANVTAAIVYGFHDIKFQDTDTPPTQPVLSPDGTFANVGNSYRISQPVLDLMMGLQWDYMFCNDRVHLGLHAGWEHHMYFSQNQFPIFVDATAQGVYVSNQGDLALQGWTIGARIDF